jgi:hypothetical protein
MLNAKAAIATSGTTEPHGTCETLFRRRKKPGGFFVMQVSRKYAWLVFAGYLGLALTIPVLTPALPQADALPPIPPLVLADNAAPDDAMMLPLRQEANAALQALEAHTARQTATAF